jgi:hypothetical protein
LSALPITQYRWIWPFRRDSFNQQLKQYHSPEKFYKMKKQFFLLTSILIAALFTSQAQFKPVVLSEMPAEHYAKVTIHPAITANFHSQYANVSDDAWAETENGYLVSFSSNGIRYNTYLNKKGKMTSQIRFYSEKELPVTVRDRVMDFYSCFTIGTVKEVTIKNSIAYLVTINNATSWKVIRVAGNEMDVFEEHKKG